MKMITIEQIQLAEVRTKGFIAHDNMKNLLEQMIRMKAKEIRWFSLPESDREILSWVGCDK